MGEQIENYRAQIRIVSQRLCMDSEFNAKVTGLKRLMEGLVARGYEVMLFHQGFGETCIFSMLMKAYTEKSGKPLMLLTMADSREQILEQCPYITGALSCDANVFNAVASDMEFRERLQIKNYLELHFMEYQADTMREEACQFLNLPFSTPYERYEIKSGNFAGLKRRFDNLGLLAGKTVFLIPSAICYGDEVCSYEFWVKLSDRLRQAGYQPVFNAEEEFVIGVPHIFISMEHIPDFCRLCGHVVGVRTGFLDVVATFTDVPIQSIYPNESCPCWEQNPDLRGGNQTHKEKAESALQGFMISKMLERENVTEFIHGDDDQDIRRIIDNLSSMAS